MPQQEGEVVAETNTANTEKQGGNKMNGTFMDRIREHKTTVIQILVVAAITVVVSALMITGMAATKGDISAEAARVNGEFDKVSTHINSLGSGINDQISDLEEEITGYGATADENNDAIEVLQTWSQGAEGRIAQIETQNSPAEGYLTGTFGNYTLHAKCKEAGNFTANVHLVYSLPLWIDGGNITIEEVLAVFSPPLDWVTPTIAYNGTVWTVTEVAFNIGTFAMAANNETAVSILFGGLNSTYAPDFAYVEVWPIMKVEA
jgi:hypothetical protein